MTTTTAKLISMFVFSALIAFSSVISAQQYQGNAQQGNAYQQTAQGNSQPAVQVSPQFKPLGVMSQFISLRAPVQIGGGSGGGIQPSVTPGYGGGGTWAYNGYRIHSVTHGGVACRAGLEAGDIILMLNGRLMTCQNALNAAVAASQHQRVACVVINVRTGGLTTVWCDFTGGGFVNPGFGGGEIRPSYQGASSGYNRR